MDKIFKISFLMFIALIFFSGCATLEERRLNKEGALEAANTWYKHLDEFNYEKLWEISSDLRKLGSNKDDFIRFVKSTREPMGKVISRDLQVNDKVEFIKHYPDGEYRSIIYWSKYEKKDFAREYFLLVKEQDRWKVLEYMFR
jgi:hypothetical protein